MERVSSREWTPDQRTRWFYERARGSYQTAKTREGTTPARIRMFEDRFPSNKRFSKEDLAKFENVWLGLPYVVSRGAQKNFVNFMQQLGTRSDGWEPSVEEYRRCVAKGILFREVQRIVQGNETITAWRINVTAYTAALVADKTARRIDLDKIWREQGISGTLKETIANWAPVVFKHLPELGLREGRHIEESFKTPSCWDSIRSLAWSVPAALECELVSAVMPLGSTEQSPAPITGEHLSMGDHNNIALCRELTEAQWLGIATWGQKAGQLEEWQRGVARTLATYAAEGWKRVPSKKQAKHGAVMIERARSAGVLNND